MKHNELVLMTILVVSGIKRRDSRRQISRTNALDDVFFAVHPSNSVRRWAQ